MAPRLLESRGTMAATENRSATLEDEPASGVRPAAPRKPGVFRSVLAWATIAVLATCLALGVVWAFAGGESPEKHWSFTQDSASLADLGLAAPREDTGAWSLEPHDDATGGRALVNHAGEGKGAALAVTTGLRARNVKVSTRCKPVSESSACGLVFRYVDEGHYYAVRAEAGRVSLVSVVQGHEREIHVAQSNTPKGRWYELRVEARADSIRISVDGVSVIETRDMAIASAGAVGLWAPAPEAAVFDEMKFEPLSESPGPLDLLPLLTKNSS